MTSVSADSLDFPRRLTSQSIMHRIRTAEEDLEASREHEDLFERSSRILNEAHEVTSARNSLELSASTDHGISVIDISNSPSKYEEDLFEAEDSKVGDESEFEYTIQRQVRGGLSSVDDVQVLLGTAMFSPSGTGNLTKSWKDDGLEFGSSASTNTQSSLHIVMPERSVPSHSSPSSSSITWIEGRAPTELIELSQALEVFVSAVRFEVTDFQSDNVALACRFLGATSSASISLSSIPSAVQQLNYVVHMKYNKAACAELASEIEREGEDLGLELLLIGLSGEESKILGSAVVNIWVMIEDSCNIMRQEVKILSQDRSVQSLGVVVVDVKGYHILQDCA